jgi:excisionase family DNA binding protein
MPTTKVQLPRLAKAKEVAAATGLPLARIYELARLNQMPVIRLGRAMRFDVQAVAEWLRNGGTGNGRTVA